MAMELYDSKWCLYSVHWDGVNILANLLKENQASLETRASNMHHWLSINGYTSGTQSHIVGEDSQVNGRPSLRSNNSAFQYLQLREDSAESDDDVASHAYASCVWKHLRWQGTNRSDLVRTHGIMIELEPGNGLGLKTTTKIVLLGQGLSLLMVNVPNQAFKATAAYLSEEMGARMQPLELSSLLLRRILGCYQQDATGFNSRIPAGKRALQAALNDLRITLSFTVAVSPFLKSLDVSISAQALEHMVSSPRPPNSDQLSMSDGSSQPSFLSNLENHLQSHTGMWVPLDIPLHDLFAPQEQESLHNEAEAALVQVKAISCAAFSLSNNGRLKLSSRILRDLPTEEALLTASNSNLLEAILKTAEAQPS